jgi:1-phosphatidylinositol-3-phosphate 5-kinase
VVTTQERQCPVPGARDTILIWSTCQDCGQCASSMGAHNTVRRGRPDRDPWVRVASPILSLSEMTWRSSVGKYMELSFYDSVTTTRLEQCGHALYRHHRRFFAWQDVLVCFAWEPAQRYEIVPPTVTLYVRAPGGGASGLVRRSG